MKKDSDRAKTPAVESVRVPAHLVLPESPQAKQLCHLHAQPSLGQSCHRPKSLVSMHTVSFQLCLNSLQPCRLWPARVLCQGGVLPGKFHGQRSLEGYNPWGYKKSDRTEHTRARTCTHTHTHTRMEWRERSKECKRCCLHSLKG